MVQKFEHQKEITRSYLAEVVEEKFSKFIQEDFKNNEALIEKFNQLKLSMGQSFFSSSEKQTKDLDIFRENFTKFQTERFESLTKSIDENLRRISDKVRENLDEGFKKTNDTFNSVLERLAKIDEAQKKIESLSSNVVSLQDVLTDKKSRGIFGEVQLQQVLTSVFGEKNDKVFQLQYKLSTGVIGDSVLFLPEPTGKLIVDSKFPLENFRRMFDPSLNEIEKKEVTKEFKNNLKKHIDDISSKYIIKDETADQAVLFLPAEAIFAEIHAYHGDIIDYAQNKRVWLASPTTFMAMLTTVQVVLNNIERSKYTTVIHQELNRLGEEFGRYRKRWDNLASHIDTVTKDVKEIHTTTEKISQRFGQISDVKIDHLLEDQNT
ncbi:MAG: DNA recombination protein RmuC [Bacteriovoracaceae bacterium]|nr:DNA recombination protein RmuC [Bacteriovoracaceae bacterium]